MKAATLAADVRRHYDVRGTLADEDLDRILSAFLIRVAERQLPGGLRELCYDRFIFLKPGLNHRTRRWLTCHAFYHILAGAGNHLYLEQLDPVLRRKDEVAAEKFAGLMLIGNGWRGHEPWEIAVEFNVPQDRVERWLRLVS